MLDYDVEAATYDVTRGGVQRAEAAAEAVEAFVPTAARTVVDVAAGTGIVTERLGRPGRRLVGVDRSLGMAGVARGRLPGGIVVGDATCLPFADGTVDVVVMIWLLHLLDAGSSSAAIAEAARVLRPGGVLITTVDKNAADFMVRTDVAELIDLIRTATEPARTDAADRVAGLAASLGLTITGEGFFTGLGQGRSPNQWSKAIQRRAFGWTDRVSPAALTELCRKLEELPEPDHPRADPRYRLFRLAKVTPLSP